MSFTFSENLTFGTFVGDSTVSFTVESWLTTQNTTERHSSPVRERRVFVVCICELQQVFLVREEKKTTSVGFGSAKNKFCQLCLRFHASQNVENLTIINYYVKRAPDWFCKLVSKTYKMKVYFGRTSKCVELQRCETKPRRLTRGKIYLYFYDFTWHYFPQHAKYAICLALTFAALMSLTWCTTTLPLL